MDQDEIWKPCLGGNYAISNLGRVRRETPGSRTYAGRILKLQTMSIGYFAVNPVINGRNRLVTVHELVAAAFIGPRPPGYDINHIDGNKKNNLPENLEYVTHKENMQHAHRTGLVGKRAKKYSSEVDTAIRADRIAGMSYSKLASKHGVTIAYAFKQCEGISEKQSKKMNASQVIQLREERALGESCKTLSERYNISETQVSAICCGLKWKKVAGPLTRTKE